MCRDRAWSKSSVGTLQFLYPSIVYTTQQLLVFELCSRTPSATTDQTKVPAISYLFTNVTVGDEQTIAKSLVLSEIQYVRFCHTFVGVSSPILSLCLCCFSSQEDWRCSTGFPALQVTRSLGTAAGMHVRPGVATPRIEVYNVSSRRLHLYTSIAVIVVFFDVLDST